MAQKVKALIVDDEKQVNQLFRWILRRAGCAVDSAGNGLAGLEKARELKPDVILLNLMMPKLDGLDMLKRLRKSAAGRRPKVLFYTACRHRDIAAEAYAAGADAVLLTPFGVNELILVLRGILAVGPRRST